MLIFVMLMTAAAFAATGTGNEWTGKYKKTKKVFRAYVDYTWEPNFTHKLSKLTITGFGVQCMSRSKGLSFAPGAVKKATIKLNIKPTKGQKKLVKDLKASRVKFPNAKRGAKAKFGSVTYYFKKTSKKQTLKVTFFAVKGAQPGPVPNAWKGSSKGTLKFTIPVAQEDCLMTLPENSRAATATAFVTNEAGVRYKYKMFSQTADYGDFSEYMADHGCSTCVLTTILNTMRGTNLTPKDTLKIIKKTNKKAYEENFSKKPSKQMPIALAGICKVLKKYKISYRYGKNSASEVTKWLKAGNPVILTIGDGSEGGLTGNTHTILLLGIQKGHVVIGDSVLKSSEIWGKDGLVKKGKLTVKDLMSYIDSGNWNVANGNYFYSGTVDRGYILVKK